MFCREDRVLCDLEFRLVGTPRELLDRASIEIARRKIHLFESATVGERVVDQAGLLEQVLPIDVRNEPEAGYDVPEGDVAAALSPMLVTHDRVCRSLLRSL